MAYALSVGGFQHRSYSAGAGLIQSIFCGLISAQLRLVGSCRLSDVCDLAWCSAQPRFSGYPKFFLAGRSLPWWAVGLSVMATQMSAITLIGTTGQAYHDGLRFIQFYFGLPFAMIILSVTAVPFFYRAKVFTAYEYLEKRFDARTRFLTSFFFLISRALGVGVVIAAPSVVLAIVLGWSEVPTIFVIGLSTTFYTMMGGVKAVAWNDVKQMLVIVLGLAACIAVILQSLPPGFHFQDAMFLAGQRANCKPLISV